MWPLVVTSTILPPPFHRHRGAPVADQEASKSQKEKIRSDVKTAGLVVIGDEILNGFTTETNMGVATRELSEWDDS